MNLVTNSKRILVSHPSGRCSFNSLNIGNATQPCGEVKMVPFSVLVSAGSARVWGGLSQPVGSDDRGWTVIFHSLKKKYSHGGYIWVISWVLASCVWTLNPSGPHERKTFIRKANQRKALFQEFEDRWDIFICKRLWNEILTERSRFF